jgi:16S rRNA (guanine(527)-N(7))-methyltransferase GidB
VNLTSITDPTEIAIKHFLDSLTFLGVSSFPEEGAFSLIDIGTGAGFPGVPLIIVRPDIRLTLLDSLAKRLRFLEELLAKLGLQAQLVHGRAEDIAHQGAFRGRYTVATARAVASLPALLEISVPFLRPSGILIAAKGPLASEELGLASEALKTLGTSVVQVQEVALPQNQGERTLLTFKQHRLAPKQYPRAPRLIKDKPL